MDDIDIFANIDNYLSADLDNLNSSTASIPTSSSNHASTSLDLSDVSTPDPKPRRPTRKRNLPNPKTNQTSASVFSIEDDDDEDDDADVTPSKGSKLTPGKGQKTAFQRFQKIKEKLNVHVRASAIPSAVEQPSSAANNHATTVSWPRTSAAAARTTRTTTATRIPHQQAAAADVIDLSDEDEEQLSKRAAAQARAATYSTTFEDAFEEENYTMQVKIKWGSAPIETVPMRRHQAFADLCTILADRAEEGGIDTDQIVLMMNERIVQHNETPDSVDYTIGKVITARHIKPDILRTVDIMGTKNGGARNGGFTKTTTGIELKIQSSLWKRPISVSMEPSKKMMVLVILCAQRLKCAPERLRLRFDGEPLDLQSTAADLELEGGEIMDLWMADG